MSDEKKFAVLERHKGAWQVVVHNVSLEAAQGHIRNRRQIHRIDPDDLQYAMLFPSRVSYVTTSNGDGETTVD